MAKEQIKGKIGILFLITLIISAISFAAGMVCSVVPVVGSLIPTVIITPAFSLSVIRVYLNLVKGKTPEAKDAFSGFDDFWTAFKASLLVGIYTFLWSLLFIIPGIIKGFSYSQTMYIVAENPGISAREAIKRSQEMMDGHKMDYFVLDLSFIGWAFLGAFTFGILYIWLIPYMSASFVNFYNDIKPAPVFTEQNEESASEENAAEEQVTE